MHLENNSVHVCISCMHMRSIQRNPVKTHITVSVELTFFCTTFAAIAL